MKIQASNHLELLDMSNSTLNGQPNDGTKTELDLIFNRPSYDFFYTTVRQ